MLFIPTVREVAYRGWFQFTVILQERIEEISRSARNNNSSLAVIPNEERDLLARTTPLSRLTLITYLDSLTRKDNPG